LGNVLQIRDLQVRLFANDPDDFVKAEIDWIAVPLKENKPYLGLCLGAQMMAKHLGASVWAHPEGRAEIGYYPLLPTAAGNALSEDWGVPWPSHVYHWHREGFDCPSGAETLATGDDFGPKITPELDRARAVIVIWTDTSTKSRWVRSEANRASKQDKLIPIKLPHLSYDDLPQPFDLLQTENIGEEDKIKAAVVAQLAKPAVEPSATALLKAFSKTRGTPESTVGPVSPASSTSRSHDSAKIICSPLPNQATLITCAKA